MTIKGKSQNLSNISQWSVLPPFQARCKACHIFCQGYVADGTMLGSHSVALFLGDGGKNEGLTKAVMFFPYKSVLL